MSQSSVTLQSAREGGTSTNLASTNDELVVELARIKRLYQDAKEEKEAESSRKKARIRYIDIFSNKNAYLTN
jgi:hypothetical protein